MKRSFVQVATASMIQWFNADFHASGEVSKIKNVDHIDWVRCAPFIVMHLGCLGVFLVGWSWTAVATACGLYFVRMFAITGVYHRYFSHRTYKTSRLTQFIFALLGASATQRGPLWWAANHREHHRNSDTSDDPHSPVQYGFFRSHAGWFMCRRYYATQYARIQDFARFPELVWLNRFDKAVPLSLAFLLYMIGFSLHRAVPSLGVTGLQLFVWGFVVSTTVLFHATATINSLAHIFGNKRYDTGEITSGWRSSPSAKAGTTIITNIWAASVRAFTGGKSTSPTTFSKRCRCSASSGISNPCRSKRTIVTNSCRSRKWRRRPSAS
jgi:stearoyl-CoA desaturase (delta-9 desaturase)